MSNTVYVQRNTIPRFFGYRINLRILFLLMHAQTSRNK